MYWSEVQQVWRGTADDVSTAYVMSTSQRRAMNHRNFLAGSPELWTPSVSWHLRKEGTWVFRTRASFSTPTGPVSGTVSTYPISRQRPCVLEGCTSMRLTILGKPVLEQVSSGQWPVGGRTCSDHSHIPLIQPRKRWCRSSSQCDIENGYAHNDSSFGRS